MRKHKMLGIGYTDLEDLKNAAECLLEMVEERLEQERQEKVKDWVDYMNDLIPESEIQEIFTTGRGDTYVLFTDGDWSMARLNPTDTYCPDVGVAVAIAHACGYDIPDFI